MKLSRTVSYALRATLRLAESDSGVPVPCSRLANDGHMPERFLLQILRTLVSHGILVSTRGIDGGYALRRAPEEISLLEVIEAINGPLMAPAPSGDGPLDGCQGRLDGALRRATELARRELAGIKLAHLLPSATADATFMA